MTAGVPEARWRRASVVPGPPNNSMQRTTLRTAAEPERAFDFRFMLNNLRYL